jgi:aminopeptidase N
MLKLLCAALLITSGADTYPRQTGIDIQHYVFRLTLTDESDLISGQATVSVRFLRAGVTEFFLDLTSVADGKGMTVKSVTQAGKPAVFQHTGDRLRITLAAPARASALQSFDIEYGGVPGRGLRIGNNKHGERTFFGLNWPNLARQWLPMVDHPYDKASSEFIIIAPSKYQVAANGLLLEETDLGSGRRRTHWKQSVPIASWLNAIAVAPFAARTFGSVKGIALQSWVFPQDRDNGITTFEVPVRQAIEFFDEKIGPYPYEKLGNVQAAGLGGGTEHASIIFYGENSVTARPATNLVAHEIAHQWFGNSVTESDWDDVWLSEGFATYFTHLFVEHYSGREAFVAGLKRSLNTVFTTEQRLPGKAIIHNNLADMSQVLNQLVYQKAGWVLHMLRERIGTETFWKGMRNYYQQYRESNASTDDFRRVMEEASGQELGWFFEQWLKRPNSPVVEGTWRYNVTSKQIEVELSQKQAGTPYRLPLVLGITAPGANNTTQTRLEIVELTQANQRFTIASDQAPSAVVLDPNTTMLMRANFGAATTGQ